MPARERRRRSRARPSRKWLQRGFAGLTAAVALAVGLTSLFDFVERKADTDEPPPSRIDARIGDVRLTTTMEPYGRYLNDTNQSFRGLTSAERREPGLVLAARVALEGSQGDRFTLRTTVFDADRLRRVPGYVFEQARLVPSGPSHATEWPFWIPYPPRRGEYFVRATILDERSRPVSEEDSPPFPVEEVPPLPSG
jgi:hypothetical protein